MTVNVYAGSEATGRPVQTLVAPVSTGNWSVAAPSPLVRWRLHRTGQPNRRDRQHGHEYPGDLHGEDHTTARHTDCPERPAREQANPSRRSRVPPGTALGDLPTVAVKIYTGSTSSGTPVQTLAATASGGAWSVHAYKSPLAEGTTPPSDQGDTAGNTGSEHRKYVHRRYHPAEDHDHKCPSAVRFLPARSN